MSVQNKKKQLLFAAIVFVMLAIAVIFMLSQAQKSTISPKLNVSNVVELSRRHDCSDKALESVSRITSSETKINDSITLLNYRANCLKSQGKLKEAQSEYKQLLHHYELSKNEGMVSNVSETLAELEDMLSGATNSLQVEAKPDADADLRKGIERL